MTAMQTESAPAERKLERYAAMSLKELVAEIQIEIERLETRLARAEVRRLQEQLQWERAYRRRGLLGRLF